MTTSMKKVLIAIAFLGFSSHNITTQAQDKLYSDEFPLGDIELLDSPLKKARDLNIETLLKYDCDRMPLPIARKPGLNRESPPILTGTASTDTWEVTICRPSQ